MGHMTGRKPGPDPEVTDDEIIRAIRETPYPAAGTNDVAERVGLTESRTRKRLKRLADEGRIGRRKIGANAAIHWIPDN